jgi:hypothetical protein
VSNTPITLLGFAGLASFGVISLLQCGTSEKWLPENIHLTTDIFADKKRFGACDRVMKGFGNF